MTCLSKIADLRSRFLGGWTYVRASGGLHKGYDLGATDLYMLLMVEV